MLFARFPQPGLAKTRLIPALGANGAAILHKRLTEHVVRVLQASGLPWEVRATGAPAAAFRAWLGQDVTVVEQGDGHLGARMARAAEPAPAILLGADLPGLAVRHLQAAVDALQHHPAAIGPAEDGGYYLLGLNVPMPALFEDMAWGTDVVFETTMRRLAALDVRPAVLETLADLDRPEDLRRWPGLVA